jgi:hypothetical protein
VPQVWVEAAACMVWWMWKSLSPTSNLRYACPLMYVQVRYQRFLLYANPVPTGRRTSMFTLTSDTQICGALES